jgi:hypothetical protein
MVVKRVLVGMVVACVLVPVALADEGGAGSGAAAACKGLQKTAPALFGPGKTYKNLGACVSAKSTQAGENADNAAKACKAEQADPNFAGSHGGKSFAEFYGTSGNAKGKGNAFGKCVSSRAKSETDADNKAELNAAKQCKSQRVDANFASSHSGKSFSDFYGTNANKKNAFGKCVSALAKQND